VDRDELRRARQVTEIVSVQNRYNLFDRRSDDLIDLCEKEGLAFLPWAPLGRGDVATDAVAAIARRHSVSSYQLAIAWLLARSPAMLPIPGTGSVAHLQDNLAAAHVRLTPAEVVEVGKLQLTAV
jgi:aryl-alcohol dehydrogenase-like predicted oxidoreductase